MSEQTPLERARELASVAFDEDNPHAQQGILALSWLAFLDHVYATWEGHPPFASEEYNRGYENARSEIVNGAADAAASMSVEITRLTENITAAVQLLPRVEELEVRADLAEALGHKMPRLTPEEPDPGRDWSRVRGELFKPSGKWAYSVWLDYSKQRHRGIRGEGPCGWHFDGAAAARGALAEATAQDKSGVTMSKIPNGWRLFVPNPPQGYPVYAVGPNETEYQENHNTRAGLAAVTEKLDEIRDAVTDPGYTDPLARVREVLDR